MFREVKQFVYGRHKAITSTAMEIKLVTQWGSFTFNYTLDITRHAGACFKQPLGTIASLISE